MKQKDVKIVHVYVSVGVWMCKRVVCGACVCVCVCVCVVRGQPWLFILRYNFQMYLVSD